MPVATGFGALRKWPRSGGLWNFGDDTGWDASSAYWGTVQPADLRAQGGDEICGRGSSGRIWCSNR